MLKGKHSELTPLQYPARIQNYGGVEKLCADALSLIDETICGLEDTPLTPEV
jgi:hypothetical protein